MKEPQIKKKNILNLIKYYAEHNDAGFRTEAYDIARYFNSIGDTQLAEYIMAVMSGVNTFFSSRIRWRYVIFYEGQFEHWRVSSTTDRN